MIGALLSLLRRVPVVGADGMLVGRELGARDGRPDRHGAGGALAGAAARRLRLARWSATTRRCTPRDAVWERWRVEPMGLRELLRGSATRCACS